MNQLLNLSRFQLFLFFWGACHKRQAEIIPMEPVRVMPERENEWSAYPIPWTIHYRNNGTKVEDNSTP